MREYLKHYFEEHGTNLNEKELQKYLNIASYINDRIQTRDDYMLAVRHTHQMYMRGI